MFYGDYYGVPNNNLPPVKELSMLLKLRKEYAYGVQHDYFDHPEIAGWTREGDATHPDSGLAVILTDNRGGSKEMYVGKHFAGMEFVDSLERSKEIVVIDDQGYGNFTVGDGSIGVWINSKRKAVTVPKHVSKEIEKQK